MSEQNILLTKFQEILRRNPADYAEPGNPEVVSILCNTEWVRILVVREVDDPTPITIDVEVSLPSHFKTSQSTSDTQQGTEIRNLLEHFIEHVKYVLKLEKSGFSVELVENGFLLLASKELTEEPDTELIWLLQPPSVE